MDMGMPGDPAVANLPITDPACIRAFENCTAFYAAENASQAAVPWASLFKYGHWTTYYYVVIIGLLFVAHVIHQLAEQGVVKFPQSKSVLDKSWALGRSILYRRLPASKLRTQLDLPANYGTWAFLIITIAFLCGVAFGPRPYYREQLGYGSPPLGVRTGLMSLACLPIIIALSGKANVVTLFTGISHERLNVIHRWVAWMSFALALLHTITFFYAATTDTGYGGYEREHYEFYKDGWEGDGQLNGVPPLAILFALCMVSIPSIRDRFHETFWLSHVVLGITYFGLMFWHATGKDSWDYLWATLAIWLSSWLARIFWKTQQVNLRNDWFDGYSSTLTSLPGDVTRIEIVPEPDFKWRAGQHVFLRLPTMQPLNNHPFTIASSHQAIDREDNTVVLLARAHKGWTRRLIDFSNTGVEGETTVPAKVWLDGPYGGENFKSRRKYNTVLLVAGGTGISATLPRLLESIAESQSPKIKPATRIRRVVLVWSIRQIDALSWVIHELNWLAYQRGHFGDLEVVVRVHVTGSEAQLISSAATAEEKHAELDLDAIESDSSEELSRASPEKLASSPGTAAKLLASVGTKVQGRPNFPKILAEFAVSQERVIVYGCGPEQFRADLANAVAGAQSNVLKGRCKELAMHLETYGW